MLANGEQTKQEIREYFNRYQRELKIREENFIEQVRILLRDFIENICLEPIIAF